MCVCEYFYFLSSKSWVVGESKWILDFSFRMKNHEENLEFFPYERKIVVMVDGKVMKNTFLGDCYSYGWMIDDFLVLGTFHRFSEWEKLHLLHTSEHWTDFRSVEVGLRIENWFF